MSLDPSPNEFDQQVQESMRMFERAQVGDAPAAVPARPQRILLALDGSAQDSAAVDAARRLASRYEATVLTLDARDSKANGLAVDLDGFQPVESEAQASYDQILAAVQAHRPDLVIVPCPFGRDFASVGADSAGTVMDVLMRRCPVPVLAIRDPASAWQRATQDVVLVVSSESESEPLAASWALALSDRGGQVTLQVEILQEQFENLREMLRVLAPDRDIRAEEMESVVARNHQPLHAALSKGAAAAGLRYRMHIPTDEERQQSPGQRDQLVILPVEIDDAFAEGFASDRLRAAAGPVLIVPTHVEQQV